jgi:hypothetical protein
MRPGMTSLKLLRRDGQFGAPSDPDDRKRYVAELRNRFLDGTLDEVLIPEKAEIPDRLMWVLFPNLFPTPSATANAPLCVVDLD